MEHLSKDQAAATSEAAGRVQDGALLRAADAHPAFGAGVAKAQVPVGGRGKAGGIRRFASKAEFTNAAVDMFELRIAGHRVRAIRIEAAVDQCAEAYVIPAINPSLGTLTGRLSSSRGLH